MPTLAVGMWCFFRVFNMPTASAGMAPNLSENRHYFVVPTASRWSSANSRIAVVTSISPAPSA